jgi:copper chaperone CopZ
MSENITAEAPQATSCCGSCGTSAAPAEQASTTVRRTYQVHGMTCGHCVGAVTAELSKLGGVAGVNVDLSSGLVTVDSETPLDDAAVAAAIDEAGYEFAGPAAG